MSEAIKVGDKVKHDFSETEGVVLEIRKNDKGYDYKVEWNIDENNKRVDWMRKKVLVKL